MAKQTLVFVVLPNGITPQHTLALSVYLTPRLTGGATLAAFPDLLDWTATLATNGLGFEVSCGSKSTTAAIDTHVLRPDVWREIFKSNTFVEAYQVPNYSHRLVVSYPVRDAMTFFKYAYQTVGSGNLNQDLERGGLGALLRDLSFREKNKSGLAQAMSKMRVQMWNEQRRALLAGEGTPALPSAQGSPSAMPPDGVRTTLTPPANTRDTITQFALFHHMPPAPNRPPLPKTPSEFGKTLDFHRALTALNSYPSLLRALGLVFDIEVPLALCPASPSGGVYGTIKLGKLLPGFKWAAAPKLSLPSTSYVLDASGFSAAPATLPSALGPATLGGDIVDGVLALTGENYQLLEVDVDGGLLKALALADNVANVSNPSRAGTSLPALRSSGIGLVARDRGLQLLRSMTDSKGFDDSLQSNAAFARPFNARDLTRGFRIDIWSSRDGQWRSLHRRNSVYGLGAGNAIAVAVDDEEGFLQPTAAQPADDPTRQSDPTATASGVPQPSSDLYIHERVARWDGWSLSAPRPGLALNRSPDPALATTPDPTLNQPVTPFKMTTSFTPVAGSLPTLRFGTRYRLRARAVDLAGNSIALHEATPPDLVLPPGGRALPYLRFEPVSPPLLVLQEPTHMGSSLERMVIRAANATADLDLAPTMESDHRHVGPPRVSERMVEQHGLIDDSHGRPRGDQATYDRLTTRDEFEFPTQGDVPVDPSPALTIGYLPDPLARGAAFRDLPNTPDDSSGRIENDLLVYRGLPDVQPRPGSVTYLEFGPDWPHKKGFLVSIAEGGATPVWNAVTRELKVFLPKGTVATVELSSYLTAHDLPLMGAWNWLREYFEAIETASMKGGAAEVLVTRASDQAALITRLVLEGGHEMITPSRTLTLVHAVQQPLGRPQFEQLPVVHRPADPIFASALRNSFTPITAWRSYGSHDATLLGGLKIHGATTAKIELLARWLEYTDDITQPAPTKAWHSDHVETLPLPTTDPGPVYSDATHTRMVALQIPKVDTLWFAAPFDALEGVDPPGSVAAPVHRFQDTRHRFVGYTAVATSRFEEYFPAGLDFTRSSEPLVVDVPSSARPLGPDIAYVVPTFGWQRQESGNVKSSVRFGNGLRVYLRRPWYSSGDGELLGVVLWNGPAPDYPTREAYKPFFTQWGNDPIWKTGYLGDVPTISDFPGAVASATALNIEETPHAFDVAAFPVELDGQRGLWYCDIELSSSQTYMPFVRLALARYQPHSIQGIELSHVVLADYAQLAPDRSAVVSIDPADPRRAQVFVGGVAPQSPNKSVIEVTVERRLAHIVSDLAWEVAPNAVVKVVENAPDASEPDAVLWSGQVIFAKTPPLGLFRVVIRELERIQVDGAPGVITLGERLVYAAIVNYDYPSNQQGEQ